MKIGIQKKIKNDFQPNQTIDVVVSKNQYRETNEYPSIIDGLKLTIPLSSFKTEIKTNEKGTITNSPDFKKMTERLLVMLFWVKISIIKDINKTKKRTTEDSNKTLLESLSPELIFFCIIVAIKSV